MALSRALKLSELIRQSQPMSARAFDLVVSGGRSEEVAATGTVFDPATTDLVAGEGQDALLADLEGAASQLQPNQLSNIHINDAMAELKAAIDTAELAANQIMESAEKILNADPANTDKLADIVAANVGDIFEACSFQDLNGQRLNKVLGTFGHIERRLKRFIDQTGVEDSHDGGFDCEKEAKRRDDDLLLHGPQMAEEATSQADIDALFD